MTNGLVHEKKIDAKLEYVDERTAIYCLYFVCLDANGKESKTCGTHPILVGKFSYHEEDERLDDYHQYDENFKLTSENLGKVLKFLKATEEKFVERVGRKRCVQTATGKRVKIT